MSTIVYESNNTLYHHGIKGQKWGVRRFQNADGTLTAKGKRRVAKEYDRVANKVSKDFSKTGRKMYADAYNETSDRFNKGEIKNFNSKWEKEHGPKSFDDDYVNAYYKHFNNEFTKTYNRKLANFYENSKSYQKAQALCDKYSMQDWHELAKKNKNVVDELRNTVDTYEKDHD